MGLESEDLGLPALGLPESRLTALQGPTMILTVCPQDNWASTTLGPLGRTVVMNQILASFSHSSQ
jgi:hypothetical protein